ncbi:hypothetical protein, partial [Staphylococcus aureus]|uniref:hypothetical protein n=1 Tax=Staphylococcus aureus TaxID=1280 RepID=UPI003D1A7BB0
MLVVESEAKLYFLLVVTLWLLLLRPPISQPLPAPSPPPITVVYPGFAAVLPVMTLASRLYSELVFVACIKMLPLPTTIFGFADQK